MATLQPLPLVSVIPVGQDRQAGTVHTGAFMANFLVRFAFDRFQPYVGAGIGGWAAESDDIDVTVNSQTSTSPTRRVTTSY